MRKLMVVLFGACVLGQTPGCLINLHGTRVVDGDVPRESVSFASDEGLAAFMQGVARRYPNERDAGGGYFGIPFIIGVSEQRVLSENAHFNEAVRRADVNADRVLTDAEVRAAGFQVQDVSSG